MFSLPNPIPNTAEGRDQREPVSKNPIPVVVLPSYSILYPGRRPRPETISVREPLSETEVSLPNPIPNTAEGRDQ